MPFGSTQRIGLLSLVLALGLAACSEGTGPDDGDGDGNGTALTSGSPLTGRAGGEDSETLYRITVPSGATGLTITTSGGTGDLDLFVREGAEPIPSAFDCGSTGPDNDEVCEIEDPSAGTWYILLVGFEAYSGATLLATVTTGEGGEATREE